MILVTGATGFIGKAVLRHLQEFDYPVRILLRPSHRSPELPRGQSIEAAICSITDEQTLRNAMVGVDTVYHFAGSEWMGIHGDLLKVDIQGTLAVCRAAEQAGVKRFFYLSHLGANRASAYPLLKAKAIAEEHIRRSGVPYTILRSGMVFGPGDHFTNGLYQLMRRIPFVFFLPDEGSNLLQPLWIEDLATCLVWELEHPEHTNQTFEIGGPEFLSFNQVVDTIQAVSGLRRHPVHIHAGYVRMMTTLLESSRRGMPTSIYWLDYLAANRTASLDALPRLFNILPIRFSQGLGYLAKTNHKRKFSTAGEKR
jgi:NADH dehydrogenase